MISMSLPLDLQGLNSVHEVFRWGMGCGPAFGWKGVPGMDVNGSAIALPKTNSKFAPKNRPFTPRGK